MHSRSFKRLCVGTFSQVLCPVNIFFSFPVRFIGKVNASNVTTQSAILSWERGPGSIRHYRLEVTGDREERRENQTDLTATLGNLTAGTRYSVKVFPVKCRRDLNPQTVVFYTSEFVSFCNI